MVCKLSAIGRSPFARPADRLPIRYMAPEFIKSRSATTHSDVWSLAVTLWEIFSIGATPYAASECGCRFVLSLLFDKRKMLNLNLIESLDAVVGVLQAGQRLQNPPHISANLHKLLLGCWDSVPQSRPVSVVVLFIFVFVFVFSFQFFFSHVFIIHLTPFSRRSPLFDKHWPILRGTRCPSLQARCVSISLSSATTTMLEAATGSQPFAPPLKILLTMTTMQTRDTPPSPVQTACMLTTHQMRRLLFRLALAATLHCKVATPRTSKRSTTPVLAAHVTTKRPLTAPAQSTSN